MQYFKLFFILFLCSSVAFISCKEESKKIIKTAPIVFKKDGDLTILKAAKDSILTNIDIEIAETEYETQTGLMYRDSMGENQGMLFVFPDVSMHSFYMKNTKIALDIIYIDENLRIASFQENAKPLDETSLPSIVPVKYVLEVNAGLAEKWRLEIGDIIRYKKK